MAEYNTACIEELHRRIGLSDTDYKVAKNFIAENPQLQEIPSDGIIKGSRFPRGAVYLIQQENGLFFGSYDLNIFS
jgi:hypothetical protein